MKRRERETARTKNKWVAQVSILRPGFPFATGATETHRCQNRDPGPPIQYSYSEVSRLKQSAQLKNNLPMIFAIAGSTSNFKRSDCCLDHDSHDPIHGDTGLIG